MGYLGAFHLIFPIWIFGHGVFGFFALGKASCNRQHYVANKLCPTLMERVLLAPQPPAFVVSLLVSHAHASKSLDLGVPPPTPHHIQKSEPQTKDFVVGKLEGGGGGGGGRTGGHCCQEINLQLTNLEPNALACQPHHLWYHNCKKTMTLTVCMSYPYQFMK